MAFWGQSMSSGMRDPKRKFRFKVQIGALGNGLVWYAKTVTKPQVAISGDTEHKFLGHTFKFPGSVTWEDVELTLVDPGGRADAEDRADAAKELLGIIEASGYKFMDQIPTDLNGGLETISKGKAREALDTFIISQLDSDGNVIEKWTLHNAFITSVNFNDLSYEDDGLSEINLTVKYDWAKFSDNANDDSQFFE